MRFDYRAGTEATFRDWEQEGCEKAEAILSAIEEKSADDEAAAPKALKKEDAPAAVI